ncbi:uncharacterized protein LOC136032366 [Artemia franciscana]|uniref:uncharacterized protein LOC136032366 n=1 Tax=Artemia franciscana TaxID=6661 RepID=UPI0032DAD65B
MILVNIRIWSLFGLKSQKEKEACNVKNRVNHITIIERQIFDFLGYQWASIAANLLSTLSVIVGAFGAYQSKRCYLYGYLVCSILWIAWNAFVTCLFLDVGSLKKEDDLLSFGTGIISWWEANGPGCKPVFNLGDQTQFFDPRKPPRPERVDGCYLDFWLVEIAHSAIQITLSTPAGRCQACQNCSKRCKNCFKCSGSIPWVAKYDASRYISPPPELSSNKDILRVSFVETPDKSHHLNIDFYFDCFFLALGGRSTLRSTKSRAPVYSVQCSPQVPRESSPNSHIELESLEPGPMTPRRVKRRSVRSNRSSGRKKHRYVNPVTKLIDQGLDSSTSTDSNAFVRGYSAYPTSNPNGVPSLPRRSVGHSNVGYQPSRPSSIYSVSNIESEPRPPSAHSSYSNWHGQRTGVSSTFLNSANIPSTSNYGIQYGAYSGFGPGRPHFGSRQQAESAI